MTDTVDSTFDWVTARNKCSLPEMYDLLMAQARVSMHTRNEILDKSEDKGRFKFKDWRAEGKGNGFTIWDTWANGRRAADVELKPSHIEVGVVAVYPKPVIFEISATLNDSAQCKFKVADDQLDVWQVLKRTLEGLFFDDRA